MSKCIGFDYCEDSSIINAVLQKAKVGFAISDYYSLIYKMYIQYLNDSILKIDVVIHLQKKLE